MSPESVAIIATISSAAVGLGAIIASALSARGGRRHAEHMSRQERNQTRREDIYAAFLEAIAFGDEIRMNQQRQAEVYRITTRISLLGSEEVQQLIAQWASSSDAIKEAATPVVEPSELARAREEEQRIAGQLRRAMRRDLDVE